MLLKGWPGAAAHFKGIAPHNVSNTLFPSPRFSELSASLLLLTNSFGLNHFPFAAQGAEGEKKVAKSAPGYGGVFAFELRGGVAAAEAFIDALTLAMTAVR